MTGPGDWGGRRVLNPPPPESQSGALPDELRPPLPGPKPGRPPYRLLDGKLVGVERFELQTSCSQSRRATRLRYTPNNLFLTRTPSPVFRRAHNTHPLDKRQRQYGDFSAVNSLGPFHCCKLSCDNTRLCTSWINNPPTALIMRILSYVCTCPGRQIPGCANRS